MGIHEFEDVFGELVGELAQRNTPNWCTKMQQHKSTALVGQERRCELERMCYNLQVAECARETDAKIITHFIKQS